MLLSIIVPVLDEIGTIARILCLVSASLPDVEKEVIIVDDGSRDGTREWLQSNFPDGNGYDGALAISADGSLETSDAAGAAGTTFRTLYHAQNLGKGAAIRSGLNVATGDVLVIQDADLEYDPADWAVMTT